MTATASPVPVQKPLRQRLIGFNLLTAIILGVAGYWIGDLIGSRIHTAQHRVLLDRGRRQRHRGLPRLLLRRHRLPDRSRLRQLPGSADARPSGVQAGPRRGHRRLGRRPLARGRARDLEVPADVDRPQDRVAAVPRRNRRVLRSRRPQRDADPHRAAVADDARVRGQPVPHAGRPARHDDDGDDDVGHPRPVRQLGRAADDRHAGAWRSPGSRRSPSGC